MKIKTQLRYLRISPRKVRLVADLVRGMNVKDAKTQLEFSNKKPSESLLKLLNSAIANAQNNFGLEKNNLYISEMLVNDGSALKRWRPRAMGRSARIKKRTSHITVVLDEITKKTNNEVKSKEKKM
jgi:large subunit ribosomal protein L22